MSKLATRIRESQSSIVLVIEDITSTGEKAVEKALREDEDEEILFVSIEESDSLTKEEFFQAPFEVRFTLSQLGPCFIEDYIDKSVTLPHPLEKIHTVFSTGERRIIKLLLILLSAQKGSMVIIDGLEVHLHPNVQSAIAAVIINFCDDIKLVCTTTSPFVIQKWQGQVINVGDII